MFSIQTDILFTGYCPACTLKGKVKQHLRLNSIDFLECTQCQFQITNFPAVGTIPRLKGMGKYKTEEMNAVDHFKDLLLAKTSKQPGREIYPNEKELLTDSFDLE